MNHMSELEYLIERPPVRQPVPHLSKVDLVGLLSKAVQDANKQNHNAQGVILYGSRTKENMTLPGSDADLVLIKSSQDIRASWELINSIRKTIGTFGIHEHLSPMSNMDVEYVHEALTDPSRRKWLNEQFEYLDKDSVIITTEPTLKEKLHQVLDLQTRDWSRHR